MVFLCDRCPIDEKMTCKVSPLNFREALDILHDGFYSSVVDRETRELFQQVTWKFVSMCQAFPRFGPRDKIVWIHKKSSGEYPLSLVEVL